MKKQIPLNIPANHPAFAGHFPGTPIVPGVVLLDEVLHAIITDTSIPATDWQISSVKFLSPLKPGESVIIEHEQSANGAIKFEVWCEKPDMSKGLNSNHQIVTGSLVLKAQPPVDSLAKPLAEALGKSPANPKPSRRIA